MTDKQIKNMLNDEVNGIVCGSRTEILGECGVKTKEKKEIGKTVFKVIGIAASVLFIAALAYVCYLPIYMQEHGLTPGRQPNDTVDTSKITARVVGVETDPKQDETEPEQKTVKINEYMKDFHIWENYDSEGALKSIYFDCVRLCMSGDIITVPSSYYTDAFVRSAFSVPEKMRYDENSYFVENSSDPSECYLVFLGAVDSLEDCRYDADPDYQYSYNRLKQEFLIFFSEFKKQGYDSLAEMIDAHLVGAFKMYSVSYIGMNVRLISSVYYNDTDYVKVWYDEAVREIGKEIYYGEFNGYRVSLEPGVVTGTSFVEIGGYSFGYGSSFRLKAEKNGIRYDLKKICDSGYLSEDDIAEINMIHRSRFGLYYVSPEETEKLARYNAGMADILSNITDQAVISRLQLSLFKSIYGSSGIGPADENAFAPDHFLVCIMKKSDGSEFTVEDFPEVKLSSVGKLMGQSDGSCSLVLYLKYPGKDNVLEAIRLVLMRDDVKYAEPDWIQFCD